MKPLVLIQARTDSKRLPNKILLKINNKELILKLYERVNDNKYITTILTTKRKIDDELIKKLVKNKINFFRGEALNVLKRYIDFTKGYSSDQIIIRLTGDNLFPDKFLINEMIDHFIEKKCQYLTCSHPSSGLPYGVSVEILRLKLLRKSYLKVKSSFDKEHVTTYIKRNFRISYFNKYSHINLSHLRSTIDTSNDYKFIKLFSTKYQNIFDKNILKLIKTFDQFYKKQKINNLGEKIIIGGAQFGYKYGILNKDFLTKKQTFDLIKYSLKLGIDKFDTAFSYGESEKRLGEFSKLNKKLNLITKIPNLSALKDLTKIKLKNKINYYLNSSLYRLSVKKLNTVLIHNSLDINLFNGYVIKCLIKYRMQGKIGKIGASVQTPEELNLVLSNDNIEIIQMPFNVFDHRWSNLVKKIKLIKSTRPLEIHARSIFLQGLLFSADSAVWETANIYNYSKIKIKLEKISKKYKCKNISELSLYYTISQNWIDKFVLGVHLKEQLNKNYNKFITNRLNSKDILYIKNNANYLNNEQLNPSLWPK